MAGRMLWVITPTGGHQRTVQTYEMSKERQCELPASRRLRTHRKHQEKASTAESKRITSLWSQMTIMSCYYHDGFPTGWHDDRAAIIMDDGFPTYARWSSTESSNNRRLPLCLASILGVLVDEAELRQAWVRTANEVHHGLHTGLKKNMVNTR